jgi:hypothetical protein
VRASALLPSAKRGSRPGATDPGRDV